MWKGVVVFSLLLGMIILFPTPADAAPYVSCRDGYIAPSLDLCPPPEDTYTPNDDPKPIGGGRGRSGLLGLGIGGIL